MLYFPVFAAKPNEFILPKSRHILADVRLHARNAFPNTLIYQTPTKNSIFFHSFLKYSSASTTGKWLGLVAVFWIQCISDNNSTFPNYSDTLKSLMHLTQVKLNGLSVAKDVGQAFGLLAGLPFYKLPTWLILLIGSVEGLIGYGAQWLVVSQKIKPLAYWQMCIFLCMGGNSTTWMNTAVLVTCIRNFRRNRGPVSGILKGFVGLSTAIFTDLCSALFAENPASFLVMLSIVPLAVCLIGIFFLREVPPTSTADEEKEESKYFAVLNAVAIVVALYLLAFDFVPSPSTLSPRIFAGVLLVLLASPLGIPLYSYLKTYTLDRFRPVRDVEGRFNEPLLQNDKEKESEKAAEEAEEDKALVAAKAAETAETVTIRSWPAVGEEHTIFEALTTIDFWILFVSFLCGVGTGLAVMNNMGQIGLALGYTDVSIFVSLMSIWGFFGRILSGMVSEYFIK